MSNLIPLNLKVKIIPPFTTVKPVEGRKYTITHSDKTGEIFLSIGKAFDYSAINPKVRDEVLAEWVPRLGQFILLGEVYVSNNEFDEQYSQIRFMIFKREMKLALAAIAKGDYPFFSCYPWLLDAPIYINFKSHIPTYNQIIYFGTPRQYLLVT